jgi:hypothetical protein
MDVGRDGDEVRVAAPVPRGHLWRSPRWSPDDAWLAIHGRGQSVWDEQLYVVSARGGESRSVCRASFMRGAAWLPDGRLVSSSSGGRRHRSAPTGPRWCISPTMVAMPICGSRAPTVRMRARSPTNAILRSRLVCLNGHPAVISSCMSSIGNGRNCGSCAPTGAAPADSSTAGYRRAGHSMASGCTTHRTWMERRTASRRGRASAVRSWKFAAMTTRTRPSLATG